MKSFPIAGLVLAFSLSGCAGFGGANPATGAAPQAMSPKAAPAIDGVAGKYAGTVKDSALGKGGAVLQITQSGNSAGGLMQLKFSSLSATSSLALTIGSNGKATGTGIVIARAMPPCSIDVTASYNRSTAVLSGTYKGFHNCAQTGTLTAKEDCYYVVATPKALDMRPRGFPRPC
jgi:hypothetical protein